MELFHRRFGHSSITKDVKKEDSDPTLNSDPTLDSSSIAVLFFCLDAIIASLKCRTSCTYFTVSS